MVYYSSILFPNEEKLDSYDLVDTYPFPLFWRKRLFELPLSDITVLYGNNGSGKSTLLKSVYRTLKHDQGEITLGGVPEGEISLRENAKRLSVVAQHNYYNFDFLIEEVVQMGRTPHKDPMEMDNKDDEAIVDDALRLVNMHHMKGRKFSSLSGGEQQRVILARALAQQTPCIVLDEPTAALDPIAEYEIYKNFNDLVRGKTTIYISHRLSSCRFCDAVAVFENGRITEYGSHDKLLENREGLYSEMWHAQSRYYV